MKFRLLSVSAILLAGVALSRADIIGNTLADDGDGVVNCNTYGFQSVGVHAFSLNIDGQYNGATGNAWAPGHVQGGILTDTETDPSLALYNELDNDSGYTWGDFHVQVTMSKPFSFSSVGVGGDWTVSGVIAPTLVGSSYIGYIDYLAGTPILAGGTLDFNYTMTFIGSTSFQEALTPSPVPEPGALALLVCGLTAFLAVRRRSA